MVDRQKILTEAEQKALEIKNALDHVTFSDPTVFGMYAVPYDGGRSAQTLKKNGFTSEYIRKYFNKKISRKRLGA